MAKEPKVYTDEDYENYAKLMVKTNALYRDNNPATNKPKSNKGYKWVNILSYIWHNIHKYTGSGVIVIPSDPNTSC